jgi:hypothetical protein
VPDKAELYNIHIRWIEACESSDKLTEWESDFIKSIRSYLESKGALTPKQVEILERIYADKTD